MPVWFRMEYLVRLATSVGISAEVMSLCAEVRFWIWALITLPAACSRLTLAPMLPRSAEHLADGVVDIGQRRLRTRRRLQVVIGQADAVHIVAVELRQRDADRTAAHGRGIAQEHVHRTGVGSVVEGPAGSAANLECSPSRRPR